MNMSAFHLDIFIPVTAALTIHEIAHGLAATKLGDSTAKKMGRISLNPVRHASLIGSLLLPLTLLLISDGKVMIGWAKAMPVNSENFRRPVRDIMLTAAAGPVANLSLALFLKMLMVFLDPQGTTYSIFVIGVLVNCFLCGFNLIPIKPLDGYHIARYFLSSFRKEQP